jgi:hydroxymethylpyrimidine/phosphomethylpyrimidine kinase
MLGSVATIEMLAQALVDHKVERLVLDPVSK